MKKYLKGLISGLMSATILFASLTVYANGGVQQTIDVIFNNVNIELDGEAVGKQGLNYKLSNGDDVPYSLIYKNTTYLPMRKVAELLDMEVTWDGATNTVGINRLDNNVEDTKLDNSTETKENTSSETSDNAILKYTDFSINNPANIGDIVLNVAVDCNEATGQVFTTVRNYIIRGNEANRIVKEWNSFNPEPGNDKEYIIIPVVLIYKAKEEFKDSPLDLTYDVRYEVFNGETLAKYPQEIICIPNEVGLEGIEVYHGETAVGVIVFMIDKDDKNPILRISCGSDDYVTWHKLY